MKKEDLIFFFGYDRYESFSQTTKDKMSDMEDIDKIHHLGLEDRRQDYDQNVCGM